MKKFRSTNSPNNPYKRYYVYLPNETVEYLTGLKNESKLSVSRLVNYAIDHERECKRPFDYDTQSPSIKFVPNAYIEEANKIEQFLNKFPKGLGLDMLVLFRRDMGIPDKTVFLLAYRELHKTGRIDFYDREQDPEAPHPENYLFINLKSREKRAVPLKRKELEDGLKTALDEIKRLKMEKMR